MCKNDKCFCVHVITATIFFSVWIMIYSMIIVGLSVFAILMPDHAIVKDMGWTQPIYSAALESVRLFFELILFFGAVAKNACLIKVYYIFGILNCLFMCVEVVYFAVIKMFLEAAVGLVILPFYFVILIFLIRRAYKSVQKDDEYDDEDDDDNE